MHSYLILIHASANLKACPHLNLGIRDDYHPVDSSARDVLARRLSHEMKLIYIQSKVSKQSTSSCDRFAAVERRTGRAWIAALHTRVENKWADHVE